MCTNASKIDIPPIVRRKTSDKVIVIYVIYNIFAVSLSLGAIFPATGPGDSALYIWNPPIPKAGRSARVNTSIPMPPIQWVNDLQKIIPCGRDSISLKIVAPVVVNPDTISKKEST